MNRYSHQLDMNFSTASNRLIKDLLFDFVTRAGERCFRCKEELTRDNFSVDHKSPWRNSDNPVELFFDLNNISYSHRSCNSSVSKRKEATHGGATYYKNKKCRCEECMTWYKNQPRPVYDSRKRREQYQRTGN